MFVWESPCVRHPIYFMKTRAQADDLLSCKDELQQCFERNTRKLRGLTISIHYGRIIYNTAVKSNALAELMNRASKIHWKNLSLTLNGRNSETKNDKNNLKVPKFSSCRGLSSTLSRKCGSTTLCGCLWVFCGCLWVFLGVCGC